MKKLVLVILVSVLTQACHNIENEEACSSEHNNYVKTRYECGDSTKEYILCGQASNIDRKDCTPPDHVPEVFMGHCTGWNFCR